MTLFDDGTNLGRAPRGVRYQIAPDARTATMLQHQTDPVAPGAFCCGSARRLAGGNWVFGWGSTNSVSEVTDTGARVFLLQLAPGSLVYRAIPVEFGVLSREALRTGMDAQYP